MFYAFGYLITLANLRMLGLQSVVLGLDPDFYVQRGARFALYVLRLVLEVTLSPVTAVVLAVAIGLIGARIWPRARLGQRLGAARAKLAGWITRHGAIVYAVLLLVLLQHLIPVYDNMTAPFRISALLFEAAGADAAGYAPEALQVRDALLADDKAALRLKFLFTLILLADSGLFLFLAWRVTRPLAPRLLLIAPFALIFAMSVIALPMVYGMIAIPNEFPTVRLSAATGPPDTRARSYFLMNAGENFLVLWDSRAARLTWVALDRIDRLEIGRKCPLPLAGSGQAPAPSAAAKRGCP